MIFVVENNQPRTACAEERGKLFFLFCIGLDCKYYGGGNVQFIYLNPRVSCLSYRYGVIKICVDGNMSSFVTASDAQRAWLVSDGKGSVLLPCISRTLVHTGQGAGKLTSPSVIKLAVVFPNQNMFGFMQIEEIIGDIINGKLKLQNLLSYLDNIFQKASDLPLL